MTTKSVRYVTRHKRSVTNPAAERAKVGPSALFRFVFDGAEFSLGLFRPYSAAFYLYVYPVGEYAGSPRYIHINTFRFVAVVHNALKNWSDLDKENSAT